MSSICNSTFLNESSPIHRLNNNSAILNNTSHSSSPWRILAERSNEKDDKLDKKRAESVGLSIIETEKSLFLSSMMTTFQTNQSQHNRYNSTFGPTTDSRSASTGFPRMNERTDHKEGIMKGHKKNTVSLLMDKTSRLKKEINEYMSRPMDERRLPLITVIFF